jgi:hypothetical protein
MNKATEQVCSIIANISIHSWTAWIRPKATSHLKILAIPVPVKGLILIQMIIPIEKNAKP